jgi:protein-tyrosine phosphatase
MDSVLFVCLGNICRSPLADGIARKISPENWKIDGAGTSAYHSGEPPDIRMQKTALKHGYDLSNLKSRQVKIIDFHNFDYIVAMDSQNYADLKDLQPKNSHAQLLQLLKLGDFGTIDVPDPYYGGEQGFEDCFSLVESGVVAFFKRVISK